MIANKRYELIKRKCSYIQEAYLDDFRYQFVLPQDATGFVVSIPTDDEARCELFNSLPENVRRALAAGTPGVVKASLDGLADHERMLALRTCAIGEFFHFPSPLPTPFPATASK